MDTVKKIVENKSKDTQVESIKTNMKIVVVFKTKALRDIWVRIRLILIDN